MSKKKSIISLLLFLILLSCNNPSSTTNEKTITPQPEFKVTYFANGATSGSVPEDSDSYTSGESLVIKNPVHSNLVKTDYSFDSWNTKADGTGISCSPGDSFTINGTDLDLYAQWSEDYLITFDRNGSTSGTTPTSMIYNDGDVIRLPYNTGHLVKFNVNDTSYRFNGWNSEADGSGTHYDEWEDQSFNVAGNFTLYAEWVPFALRDKGPWDGYVFYDKGTYSAGWRYLGAYKSDLTAVAWGGNSDIPTSQSIGTGKENTADIISDLGTGYYAAYMCDYASRGEYDDWFLPSLSELAAMREELYLYGLGDFNDDIDDGRYWSSSQDATDRAYSQNFNTGSVSNSYKNTVCQVRPVWRF